LSNLSSVYPCRELSIQETIFSDSRSVLDALSFSHKKSNANYLIPTCRSKFHSLPRLEYSINLASLRTFGIPGNERVDLLAKQAAINGRKPKFKIPSKKCSDYCAFSVRDLREKSSALLKENFLSKEKQYYSYFCKEKLPSYPWFHQLSIPREQIVFITRIRSNHYNLNFSLYRKNIVRSAACECRDPHQDINHVIFYCPQTRQTSSHLIYTTCDGSILTAPSTYFHFFTHQPTSYVVFSLPFLNHRTCSYELPLILLPHFSSLTFLHLQR